MDGGTLGGVGRVPALDLQSAHKDWLQSESPVSADALIGHLKPTLQKAITTYVGPTASPTVMSQAKLMALDAARKFNPKAGADLKTHVFSQLQGLKRYAGREGLVVQLPERLALQKRTMDRAAADFKAEHGRDPSDDELSYRSGLPAKSLARIRRTPAVINEGRFYQGSEESDIGLPAVENDSRPRDAWRDFLYHNSSEQDKLVMEHSLGLNGKPILDNVALAAKLRVSPAAVSQRRNKIQKQLDEFYTLRPF